MSRLLDMEAWDAYGVVSAIPASAPYNILYPAVFDVVAVTNAPWLPAGSTGHALRARGSLGPATSTNPGPGAYAKQKWSGLQAAIAGLWFIIDTMPTTSVAFFRMNDGRLSTGGQVPPFGVDQSYLSLGPATPTNGALTQTAGGTLAATTYFVRSTWVGAAGETLAATETSLAVSVNNVLNVAAPANPPGGATGWNVYVSTATGTETRQNGGTPIGISTAWVEPTTGLVSGAALPGTTPYGLITSLNSSNISHGSALITTGAWHFLEIYYFMGVFGGGTNLRGSMQLNLDGTALITNANAQTVNGGSGVNGFGSYAIDNITLDWEFDNGGVARFGPWYWMDPQGAGAAAMYGKQYFQTVLPTAVSGVQSFTDSGGGYITDITTIPPGAGYIFDVTQGATDVCSIGSVNILSINATMAQIDAAESARGGRMVGPAIKSGTVTQVVQGMSTPGGPQDDVTTFQIRRAISYTDPNTGVAWTAGGISNAKIGQQVFE